MPAIWLSLEIKSFMHKLKESGQLIEQYYFTVAYAVAVPGCATKEPGPASLTPLIGVALMYLLLAASLTSQRSF